MRDQRPEPDQPFFRTLPSTTKSKLQFKTGDFCTLYYAYLVSVRYDVTGSIELQFPSTKVVIEGRHLLPLYEALSDQAVALIREADRESPGSGIALPRSVAVTSLA
jgi:hypothetical protein